MDYFFQVTISLIGVLGLIFLAFYGMRKLNRGVVKNGGRRMKVIDRVNLGQEKMILVVSVCGKCMVIGATAHQIEKICDLDCTEEEYMAELYPGAKDGSAGFKGKNGNPTFFESFSEILAAKAQGREPFKGRKEKNRYLDEDEKSEQDKEDKE